MTYTEVIKGVLEKNPELMEGKDNKKLSYLVYKEICERDGEALFIPFRMFKKLPEFETITRTRRKIYEEKVKANSEVIKKDGKMEIVEIPNSIRKNMWMR